MNDNDTPSQCANWLAQHSDECRDILREGIEKSYDETLSELVEFILDADRLSEWEKMDTDGCVYHCVGEFKI